MTRYITVAIHTFDRALSLRSMLEAEGIEVMLQNVNLTDPAVASGVRVRIPESDLPLALRIIENADVFSSADAAKCEETHSILVPVDFSDYSMQAAVIAARLAAQHNASLRLLHSYIDPYVAANMQLSDNLTYEIADADSRERLEATATRQMQKFTTALTSALRDAGVPPVKYSTKIVEGVPEDVIVEYGRINPPLMVVMGTRASERKERELIGSVSAEVLDAGRFSVLTVPEPLEIHGCLDVRRVLFFCNLEQQDILAIDSFSRLIQPAEGTEVSIVRMPPRRRFARSASAASSAPLLAYCREHYPSWTFSFTETNPDDIAASIRQLHADTGFDLIVVPNRRKSLLGRVFSPGLANTILFRADLPMLVIPV